MKIAMLGSARSIHIQRWLKALRERGHDITLFSLDQHPTAVKLRIPAPYGYYLNAPELRSTLKQLQPDILHTHYASGYGTLARLTHFGPALLSVWGSDVYEFPFQSERKMRIIAKNLDAASKIASTGHRMAAHVIEHFPHVKQPIAITPFGVETKVFVKGPEVDRPLTIGTVKSLDRRYGIDILILAAAELMKTHPKLKFVIYGDGPQRSELVNLVATLNLQEVVELRPAVGHSDVPSALSELDIFVAASRIESFGVAVIEASSSELPVVVSDVGGLPEVVEDGKTGMIVPPENPTALANALETLIRNPELRKELGVNGRTQVQAKYEWRNCVSIMESVYDSVLDRSNMSRAA